MQDGNHLSKTYGRLICLSKATSRDGRTYHNLLCDCGQTVTLPTYRFANRDVSKNLTTCGICSGWDKVSDEDYRALSNRRVGWLTVKLYVGRMFLRYVLEDFTSKPYWKCLCKCGAQVQATTIQLRRERVGSCTLCARAYKLESFKNRIEAEEQEHRFGLPKGQQEVLTEQTYRGMRYRVRHNPEYKHVKIHPTWLEKDGQGYRNFVQDIGLRTRSRLSLERLDNLGDYTPNNCKWADRPTQDRNKSTSRFLKVGGQRMNLVDFASLLCLKANLVSRKMARLVKNGLSEDEAAEILVAEMQMRPTRSAQCAL